jgi:cytochrome c6
MLSKLNWMGFSAMLLFIFGALNLVAWPARSQTGGEALYKTKCAVCHGADGKGETTVGKTNKVRDFASADVQKQSDADLTGIITNGKNKMPAYGRSLKPEQVKDLVAYVRSFGKKS